jgi:hypothetical protein
MAIQNQDWTFSVINNERKYLQTTTVDYDRFEMLTELRICLW